MRAFLVTCCFEIPVVAMDERHALEVAREHARDEFAHDKLEMIVGEIGENAAVDLLGCTPWGQEGSKTVAEILSETPCRVVEVK